MLVFKYAFQASNKNSTKTRENNFENLQDIELMAEFDAKQTKWIFLTQSMLLYRR